MQQRVRLIVNPTARRLPSRTRLQAGAELLRRSGWLLELCHSPSPAGTTALAAAAASAGYECVVACGGDGTLNAALNGVAESTTALAVLPAGTVNVWAREAGIPRDPLQALQLVATGTRVRIDAGRAGERYFLLMASAGIDSLTVARVGGLTKRRFGQGAYLAQALRQLYRFHGLQAEVSLDGRRISTPLLSLVVGNTRLYGGLLRITGAARADDGLLDACLYRGSGRPALLQQLLRTLLHRHRGDRAVLYQRARQIELTTNVNIPVQADGEIAGVTPIRIQAVPRAVSVVVAPGRASPLWIPPTAL